MASGIDSTWQALLPVNGDEGLSEIIGICLALSGGLIGTPATRTPGTAGKVWVIDAAARHSA
jgi:hypothetical protein